MIFDILCCKTVIIIYILIMLRYYFLLASQDFLFYQEPVEEILRERIKHYHTIKKDIDFGFTTDLDFLDQPDLEYLKQQLIKPSAAIISLNPKFISWLKLRIHYAFTGSFISSSVKKYNKLFLSDELISL